MFRVLLLIVSFSYSLQIFAHGGLPDFTKLIKEKSPAVVKINTTAIAKSQSYHLPRGERLPDIFRDLFEPRQMPERSLRSSGSGFFISADGYLLTNHHVIDEADEIIVRLTDRREFEATVVGTDPRSDLALLKVEAQDLPFLEFANSEEVEVGEWVVAIGSPFGLDFSASAGIVSAIGRNIPNGSGGNYVPFIQTDVAINPGNSGGPLFNLQGDVVGVNSQIYTNSGGSIGLSFAVPASLSKNVVAQLKDKGHVDRGWLGVVIQDVDKDLANSFGLPKPKGALISQLERSGPADKAGLRIGDVILKFNGIDILTSGDLPHAVGATAPGEKVEVEVMRKGKVKRIDVLVGTLDKNQLSGSTYQEEKSSSANRLGLVVDDVAEEVLSDYHLSGGVSVVSVESGSPAAKAGSSKGDVIAQLGFEEVDNKRQFEKLVKGLPEKSLLPIRFISNGRAVFRTIMIDPK